MSLIKKNQTGEEIEDNQIGLNLSETYIAYETNNLLFTSSDDIIPNILSRLENEFSVSSHLIDKMEEKCHQIYENVKSGKANNYIINLNQGIQIFDKKIIDLDAGVLKILTFDNGISLFISFKKGEKVNILFLIGDDCDAYAIIRDKNNQNYYVRIWGLYLLSVTGDSESETESGWITSYSWMLAKVSFSEILAYSLEPIKALLFSDWLNSNRNKKKLEEKEKADE